MVNLSESLQHFLNDWHFDIFLIALLIFAIVYGVLQSRRLLSEDATINGIIALVLAFFVAAASIIVESIKTMIVNTSIFLIVILALLLLAGMFGLKIDFLQSDDMKWVGVALGVIFFVILLLTGLLNPLVNVLTGGQPINLGSDWGKMVPLIIMLIFFGAAIYLVTKEGGSSSKKS